MKAQSVGTPLLAPDDSLPAADRAWTWAILALVGLACVLLIVAMPHAVSADGSVRFVKLDRLLRDGTFSVERFSYIGPLFASPLWLVIDDTSTLLWWCGRFNVLVLAAGALFAILALRPALPVQTRATFALLLVATGTLPNAARDFYGEMFTTVAVGSGFLAVTVSNTRLGWVPVVLGVANTPASIVGLLLVAIARVWKSRRLDAAVALIASAALIAAENLVTRGSVFATGYQGDHGYITVLPFSGMPGFSYPFVLGCLALLFSFGKGLLFFSPALLLVNGARRARPILTDFFEFSVAFLAGLLLVYSSWWSWYAGWTWGPRFLLFAAYPSALALAISLFAHQGTARSLATLALAAWTVWVGVSGAVFNLQGLDQCTANQYALEHLCWFVPEYSPLLHPLVLPPENLAWNQRAWMLFAAVVAAVLITFGPSSTQVTDAIVRRIGSVRRGRA